MKGNEKLIAKLNQLLAEELTSINQYMVHSEMCNNWGYEKLHKGFEKRAIDEMKHAEKLIARIIFLEGTPVVNKLSEIKIGSDVPQMVKNDLKSEVEANRMYNNAIIFAGDVKDFATRELLEEILLDEDRHIDELEELLDQISQMGVEVFLSTQID